jgi:hypothetical protein
MLEKTRNKKPRETFSLREAHEDIPRFCTVRFFQAVKSSFLLAWFISRIHTSYMTQGLPGRAKNS